MSGNSDEDEAHPMLPDESIALNPTPKLGSELKLTNQSFQRKKRGKRNRKKVMFGNSASSTAHHSIIRELLDHPTSEEDDKIKNEFEEINENDVLNPINSRNEQNQNPQKEESMDPELYKAKVKALSEWNNITNIDQFLELVYEYYIYRGHGPLILHDISNLVKLGFMIVFSSVLAYFVDWSFLNKPASFTDHPKLWEVLSVANFFRQISLFGIICIVVFGGFWWVQFMRFWNRLPMYDQVARFYRNLLAINDRDFGDTVDFADVSDAIMKLHDKNKIVGDSLDARDICNRIMRRDNYIIALINRDLLHLNKGLPRFLGGNAKLMTRILEWNISFCLLGYVFEGEKNSIRAAFLKTTQRDRLAGELRKRFQLLAIINFVMIPFLLVFSVVYFLFRYGEEFYRNPTSVTDRTYSPWSNWTLREFNELDHLFEKRLAASHEKAAKYIESFPAPKYTAGVKIIAFISGSIVLVLLMITVINEDLLMHFELTEGKSIIWFLGFFGAILTISRSLIPNPRAQYFDKISLLKEVSTHLHYSPDTWKRNPESVSVREELKDLFPSRYFLFGRELLGLFLNPYILYFSLPTNSEELVEFFREFSVEVDGIGYVCSFALFDFERHGDLRLLEEVYDTNNINLRQRRLIPLENSYLQSKNGKMEKSMINFKVNNPLWKPDANVTKFIDNLSVYVENSTNELAKSLNRKKSKRASLILSKFNFDPEIEKKNYDDMIEGNHSYVDSSNLYINNEDNEEDRKEKVAANVISVLELFRSEVDG